MRRHHCPTCRATARRAWWRRLVARLELRHRDKVTRYNATHKPAVTTRRPS